MNLQFLFFILILNIKTVFKTFFTHEISYDEEQVLIILALKGKFELLY